MQTTGAVLAARSGFDSAIGDARPYGGMWQGPIFVLTHHLEDAREADGITLLSCPVEEAVRVALHAADGKSSAMKLRFARQPATGVTLGLGQGDVDGRVDNHPVDG